MTFKFDDPIHQADWLYCEEHVNDAEVVAMTLFTQDSPSDPGAMQNLMSEVDRQNELLCDSCAKLEALYDVAIAQETRKIMRNEPNIAKTSITLLRDFARAEAAEVLSLWATAKHRMRAFESTAIQIQARLKYTKPVGGG